MEWPTAVEYADANADLNAVAQMPDIGDLARVKSCVYIGVWRNGVVTAVNQASRKVTVKCELSEYQTASHLASGSPTKAPAALECALDRGRKSASQGGGRDLEVTLVYPSAYLAVQPKDTKLWVRNGNLPFFDLKGLESLDVERLRSGPVSKLVGLEYSF